MTKSKINYHQKELKELLKILKEKESATLEARIEIKQRKSKNVHTISKIRKEIARIKTAIRAKELKV